MFMRVNSKSAHHRARFGGLSSSAQLLVTTRRLLIPRVKQGVHGVLTVISQGNCLRAQAERWRNPSLLVLAYAAHQRAPFGHHHRDRRDAAGIDRTSSSRSRAHVCATEGRARTRLAPTGAERTLEGLRSQPRHRRELGRRADPTSRTATRAPTTAATRGIGWSSATLAIR